MTMDEKRRGVTILSQMLRAISSRTSNQKGSL